MRKRHAEAVMAWMDDLPPQARDVLHGLSQPRDINLALADGCRTQADAEEWVRAHYGRSAVERLA